VIPNLTTSVSGAAAAHTFTAFTDSVSVAKTAYGANLCGVPTYRITMDDGTTAVPAYLTLSGTTLTASTTDPTFIGTHNIRLYVELTPYSISVFESFQVIITECVPSITAPTLANQAYAVNAAAGTYTHPAFTDANSCGYTFTYTAFLVAGTETALPTAYATYTAGTLTFSYSTTDANDAGVYTIKVYGTLDNTATTASSATYTLTVSNGCAADALSLTTAIGA